MFFLYQVRLLKVLEAVTLPLLGTILQAQFLILRILGLQNEDTQWQSSSKILLDKGKLVLNDLIGYTDTLTSQQANVLGNM
jgi:hypothetical protein